MNNFWRGIVWAGAVALLAGGCGAPETELPPDPLQSDLAQAVEQLDGGKVEEALSELTRIVNQSPTNAVAQLSLGVACEQAGRLDAAIAAYREAAALRPSDARPLELAARVCMRASNWQEARRLLDQANRREAYSPRILTTMGVVEQRAGHSDLAEAFFAEAIKADETYAPALYNAAVLQRDQRKDRERALGLFEAFLEHAPEDDPRRKAVREFVASQGAASQPAPVPAVESKQPTTQAVASATPPAATPPPKALPSRPPVAVGAKKPNSTETPGNRLWVSALKAHREGDMSRAIELYKAALAQDPNLFGAWYNLGLVAKAEGDRGLARQAFEKALTLRPSWPDAMFMLAVVVHQDGDDARATELLDQLLASQPRHVKANYLLAVIYAKAGRHGMARTHFEHVLRLDGNGEFGQQARDWLKENERKSPPQPKR